MKDRLLHIPEGVKDIYDIECEKKNYVERQMRNVLNLHGFRDIQTPMFEFFDIFSEERGTVPSKQMYKFFDREGNTLVLRPDITPSLARCVAKYYKNEEMPIRLSYAGETFINNSRYQGKLKQNTQVGAELYNESGADADAEMIAISIECLLKSGLTEFQIDLGNAAFFNGLMEVAGFDEDEIDELRELIEEKNIFGATQLIENKNIDEEVKEIITKLPELFGNHEIIDYARTKTTSDKAISALDRIDAVYERLKEYGYDNYISFDLGMVNQYDYYTGIIFRAYTYGTGEVVATGGRYDKLLSQFGKNSPAIGLVVMLDQVMIALNRQKVEVNTCDTRVMIVFDRKFSAKAIALANQLRLEGKPVEMIRKSSKFQLEDYKELAKRSRINEFIYINDEN